MKIYFSPSAGGFFNDDIHGARTSQVADPLWVRPEGADETIAPLVEVPNTVTNIPTDAVEVSDERYRELFDGQAAGKQIVADANGLPTLIERAGFSTEQQWENLRDQRNKLLASTDWTQGGDVPASAADKYRAYRQALRDLPATTKGPSEVTWPKAPA